MYRYLHVLFQVNELLTTVVCTFATKIRREINFMLGAGSWIRLPAGVNSHDTSFVDDTFILLELSNNLIHFRGLASNSTNKVDFLDLLNFECISVRSCKVSARPTKHINRNSS